MGSGCFILAGHAAKRGSAIFITSPDQFTADRLTRRLRDGEFRSHSRVSDARQFFWSKAGWNM